MFDYIYSAYYSITSISASFGYHGLIDYYNTNSIRKKICSTMPELKQDRQKYSISFLLYIALEKKYPVQKESSKEPINRHSSVKPSK